MMRGSEPTSRRTARAVVVILAAVLVVRVAVCVVVAWVEPARVVTSDTPSYEEPARALLYTGRFAAGPDKPDVPETVRTPGYPVFIAAVYAVFGERHVPVIVLQIALSVATLGVVYWLATRLWDARVGLIAVVFLALDLASFHTSEVLLTDTLFTFLLMIAVVAGYKLTSGARTLWRWALVLGVMLAVATMVRPIAYYLVAPVLVGLLIWGIRTRLRWRPCAAMLALVAVPSVLLVGGWQVRNYAATGSAEFSQIEGYNLLWYRGAGIIALRDGISFDEAREKIRDSLPDMEGWTTAETYDFYGREGMALVRRHPFLFLRMQVRQTAYVLLAPAQVLVVHLLTGVELRTSPFGDLLRLAPGDYARTWVVGRPALFVAFLYEMAFLVALYVCALYGIWRAFRGSRAPLVSHLFACGIVVYVIALSAGPEAHSRFRVPFMPLLALYAGLGLSVLVARLRGRRARDGAEDRAQASSATVREEPGNSAGGGSRTHTG